MIEGAIIAPEDQLILDRLVAEWKKHNDLIIACDFDDTISPWSFFNVDYESRLALLRRAQKLGTTLIIWTATVKERYSYIQEYCKEHGLEVHSININKTGLPYGNDGKIYANIFLDDRGGITQSLRILEAAITIMEQGQ